MKDSIALLLTAVIFAALAWGFWFLMGADGFDILMLAVVIYLAVDNFRLRKALRTRHPE